MKELLKKIMGRSAAPDTGLWGEQQAEVFLRKKGFRILGRRVKVGRDELDLIVRDAESVVFVEVKTRRTVDFGRPAAAVNRRKRHALSRAAVHYLKRHGFKPVCVRFDVVEVIGTAAGVFKINHIENAFTLDACYRLPY